MSKIKYIIRCVRYMDFRGMLRTVREIARESRRLPLCVFIDMIWCALRYGAGYVDYRIFNFARLSAKQRGTFVTRGINNDLIRRLNNRSDYRLMDDKAEFNKLFGGYIGRGWIDLRDSSAEQLAAFLAGKRAVIAKPVSEISGKGVIMVEQAHRKDPKELYCRLKQSGQVLVEEVVAQHHEISRLYPGSVNTLRLVTIAMPDEVHIVYRAMRFGVGENVVDNFNSGGMFALVNDSGIIYTDAINKQTEMFHAHPTTGEVFEGTQIPFFAEAQAMTKEAARLVPGIRYAGWDVAITETGPLFIEANHNPGHDMMQSKLLLMESEYGLLPLFRRITGQTK
ncbi:MAG: hypothetical protein FWH00_00650 [Oscillospiraceae bacterium]|nr:hypothetical protein [Oscillospiraceae bacterium]